MTESKATDKEREAFEAWAKKKKLLLDRSSMWPDRYSYCQTDDAWDGWCAALSSRDEATADAVDALDAKKEEQESQQAKEIAIEIVRLANRMVTAAHRDGILRQGMLLPAARLDLIDFLIDFPPFVPSGGCTCAGPDAPCESCASNEEGYREWLAERDVVCNEIAALAAQERASTEKGTPT